MLYNKPILVTGRTGSLGMAFTEHILIHYTYDLGLYFTILASIQRWKLEDSVSQHKASKVRQRFKNNSSENAEWETVESLRKLIEGNVDATFTV